MVRKTIPAEIIINCDRCGTKCDNRIGICRMKTLVKVSRSSLDALGDPVCDGSFAVDLCDTCSNQLYDFVYGNED